MADKNVTIKRWSSSTWDVVYPKTTIANVANLSSTLADLSSDINDKANLSGANFTGNVKTTTITNNYYAENVYRFFTTDTPVQTVIYTGIKYLSGTHMPVVRIYGYAYGLTSPIELKIGFYIYGGNLGWAGAVSMGAWRPNIYLFKYTSGGVDYVAIGLVGSVYFLGFQVDVQLANIGSIDGSTLITGWTSAFKNQTQINAGETIIPAVGVNNCVEVVYKSTLASMLVQFNGSNQFYYDGAVSRTLNITPSGIGAAPTSHSHPKSQITNFDSEVLALSPAGARPASDVYSWAKESTKPTYTAAEVGAAATSHTHDDRYYTEGEVDSKIFLKSHTDNRNINTIPNDYNSKFEIKGLKTNSVIGITGGGTYSALLGIRGWTDSSGGEAHELAFDSSGRIAHRYGTTTAWNTWTTLVESNDTRLTDTRTPKAHTHSAGDITSRLALSQMPTALAGLVLKGNGTNNPVWDTVSWDEVSNKPSWIDTNKPTYGWDEISSKPTWIGANKPTYGWDEVSNKPSWIDTNKPSYTWTEIGSKPSWIGASKPSYAYSEISGKPTNLIRQVSFTSGTLVVEVV